MHLERWRTDPTNIVMLSDELIQADEDGKSSFFTFWILKLAPRWYKCKCCCCCCSSSSNR